MKSPCFSIPVLAGLALAGFTCISQATTLYKDTFTNRTGVLNGTAPTTDNSGNSVTWAGDTNYNTDGTYCITPQPGQEDYTWPTIGLPYDGLGGLYPDPTISCDVKLDNTTTGDWFGIGFGNKSTYWDYHLWMQVSGNGNVGVYYGYGWAANTITNNVAAAIPGSWNTISIQYSNSPIANGNPGSVTVVVNGNYVVKQFPLDNTVWADGGVEMIDLNSGSAKVANFAVTFGSADVVAPSFSTEPPSVTHVFETAPLTLPTVVSGTLPFSYQWYKNGVAVTGETSGNLSLASANATNTGNYTLVVTNTAGAVTSTVAQVFVHLKNDKVLAQRNFDDILGDGYNQAYAYSDFGLSIPTTNGVVAGVGVGGSQCLAVGWDGTPFSTTNKSWCGVAGQAVFQSNLLANLGTAYLPAIEFDLAVRAEGFTNGPTTSFGLSLNFTGPNSISFGGGATVNVSSNWQTFTLTMDQLSLWGGDSSRASFATNYGQMNGAQVTATSYNPSTDFPNDTTPIFFIDNVRVTQRTSPPLAISTDGVHTTVTWADPTLHLMSTPDLTVPFTDVVGTSPYQAPAGATRFYRTRW